MSRDEKLMVFKEVLEAFKSTGIKKLNWDAIINAYKFCIYEFEKENVK